MNEKKDIEWNKYNSNYVRYTIKLHKRNDADIIEMLQQAGVQPYAFIKGLLRIHANLQQEVGNNG